jgi:folate-binding protein YgfZ
MRVIDDGQVTYLLLDAAAPAPAEDAAPARTSAGDPDALQTFLSRMVFTLRVEVGRSELRTVGLFAPAEGAAELAVPAAAPHGVPLVWRDPWGGGVESGGWQYSAPVEHPASTWSYREVLVEPDADLAALPAAGTLALEALRIAAWRPRIGDADERTIPHELDWLRSAVHLSKGCYRGQETVAKVHNLGHPPRRLVMLHLDGSDGVLPARGSEVRLSTVPDGADAERASVGSITASALHHDLGPIALAVIKRTVDPAAPLIVRPVDDTGLQIAAAQELIVPPDAGAEANVPRLPRLGAVTR